MELPNKLLNLVDQLGRMPGVGDKTALRQSLIMAKWSKKELDEFAQAVNDLATLNKCENCGMYADQKICLVCSDSSRVESGKMCVVESVTDCLAIERSGQFLGVFHILGGVLNPLMGIGPEELELSKMVERIKRNKITEVIIAVNPSVEGDATSSYINKILPEGIIVDRIGFGIPMGGSLEYLDSMTITKALENRKKM